MNNLDPQVCVSIVSHSHGQMVVNLVEKLLKLPEVGQVLVTCNLPECLDFPEDSRIIRIDNQSPRGFGENHNAAFKRCAFSYYCVLNPDVDFNLNPFPFLLDCLQFADLCAPMVIDPEGGAEDSIRHFPTLRSLIFKILGFSDGRYCFSIGDDPFVVDWVAGMFMIFQAQVFDRVGGFDEKFFLYYEDVDICARLWKLGGRVLACPKAKVIHDARRASRRDLRYFRWHLASMARYFWKHFGHHSRGTVP